MSSNTLHRVFEGELYESWYPNSQRVNDPDDEPQRWRVVFMFEKSDARLTNSELLKKMLHCIKTRDIYLSDVDQAGYHPLTFTFPIVTITDTDEDILDEAEIVVENWIENYRLREIRAPFCRQHIFGS